MHEADATGGAVLVRPPGVDLDQLTHHHGPVLGLGNVHLHEGHPGVFHCHEGQVLVDGDALGCGDLHHQPSTRGSHGAHGHPLLNQDKPAERLVNAFHAVAQE